MAGASLLIDYVLTVAVSVSAGAAAVISLPFFRHLAADRVLICLGFVAVLTLGNLRGLKESGRVFAVPTYVYIVSLRALVVYGLYRVYLGDIAAVAFDPQAAEGVAQTGGSLSLFLLLRGFSSGAVALTGVEAISNGVPAFRKPEARNAATTLVAMGLILGTPQLAAGRGHHAAGATATGAVLVVVAVTKFAVGAWLPIVVVPLVIVGFRAIHRHYACVERALAVQPGDVRTRAVTHTMVVLVGQVHRGTVEALNYARSLRPDHLVALCAATDEDDAVRRATSGPGSGSTSPWSWSTRPIATWSARCGSGWTSWPGGCPPT